MKTTLNILIVACLLAACPLTWAKEPPKPATARPAAGATGSAAAPAPDKDKPADAAPAMPAEQPTAPPTPAPPEPPEFSQTVSTLQAQQNASVAELSDLQKQIGEEKIPLTRKLNELEDQLTKLRNEYQQTSRLLDSRSLDLHNLETQIKGHKDQATYLTNLLNEYSRNFESRLHISELQRYKDTLGNAHKAMETPDISEHDLYAAQSAVIDASMGRLAEELKGVRFTGKAVDAAGLVKTGQFALMGPAAIFRSDDGKVVGTVEQHLGSLEPTIVAFEKPEDAAAASQLLETGSGSFPLDPSLGKAHVIASTKETLIEHVKKGGPVMIPIFALAGVALLVALYKWVAMMLVRSPSQKRIAAMLDAVGRDDKAAAIQQAKAIGGPGGKMLLAGVEHLGEPPELIEEVMFEKVLSTRLKLNRWLPFIAITSSAAPLLGLLGTVTGIMNTFKLITVFGTGDVKTLSSGISEALITTEYGLYVAIPSLLMHAFLSRKAKGLIDRMEKSAVALINRIAQTQNARKAA